MLQCQKPFGKTLSGKQAGWQLDKMRRKINCSIKEKNAAKIAVFRVDFQKVQQRAKVEVETEVEADADAEAKTEAEAEVEAKSPSAF